MRRAARSDSASAPGNDHDVAHAEPSLAGIEHGVDGHRHEGDDADGVRAGIRDHGAIPDIPDRSDRKTEFRWQEGDLSPAQSRRALLQQAEAAPGASPRDTTSSAPTSSLRQLAPCEFCCYQLKSHGLVSLASSLPVLLLSNSELFANLVKVVRRLSCP